MTDREQNNWLTFNMNMLGCSLLKKQLGAYFTPDKYVRQIKKQLTEYRANFIEKKLFQYQIEFKAKVMIVIIIFVSIIVVINCLASTYLSKYTNNFYELLSIQFMLSTFPGWIVWKFLKKIE